MVFTVFGHIMEKWWKEIRIEKALCPGHRTAIAVAEPPLSSIQAA